MDTVKFIDASTVRFTVPFFYTTMQSFVNRLAGVPLGMPHLENMREQLGVLWSAFDESYKQSQKSFTTRDIGKWDKERDLLASVIMNVAKQWARLSDEQWSLYGLRVEQVFKNYNFRPNEALLTENVKLENIGRAFAQPELDTALTAMGLREVANRLIEANTKVKQMMTERTDERASIVVGAVKTSRDALEKHYREMVVLLNALQTMQPSDALSQAAQLYNADFQKVETQIAQSGTKGKSEEEAQS